VRWSELGVSNNLGIDDGSPWLFQKVRSFQFDAPQYFQALGG